MLTGDKIKSIYCIVDDILKGIKHKEDSRRRVSDSEIITTALVSALYFPNIFLSFGACFLSVESLPGWDNTVVETNKNRYSNKYIFLISDSLGY